MFWHFVYISSYKIDAIIFFFIPKSVRDTYYRILIGENGRLQVSLQATATLYCACPHPLFNANFFLPIISEDSKTISFSRQCSGCYTTFGARPINTFGHFQQHIDKVFKFVRNKKNWPGISVYLLRRQKVTLNMQKRNKEGIWKRQMIKQRRQARQKFLQH